MAVMSAIITRLYNDNAAASRAVKRLEDAIAGREEPASSPRNWAIADVIATIGGALLILVVLTLLVIPGVGAIAAGALFGWLIQRAMDEKSVEVHSETVRRGGILVTASVPDSERALFEAILDQSSVDRDDQKPAYRKAS